MFFSGRKIRLAAVVVAASFILGACGTGTESTSSGGEGRNTALQGDDGLPFVGLNCCVFDLAVDPTTKDVWAKGTFEGTALQTGGFSILQTPDYNTPILTVPRVDGAVFSINPLPATNEIVIAGSFRTSPLIPTQNLAIIGQNGARRALNLTFMGDINDTAVRGNRLFLAGIFQAVLNPTNNVRSVRPGFAVLDLTTNSLINTGQNIDLLTRSVRGLYPSGEANSTRIVIFRNGNNVNDLRTLELWDWNTGALVRNLIDPAAGNIKNVVNMRDGTIMVLTATSIMRFNTTTGDLITRVPFAATDEWISLAYVAPNRVRGTVVRSRNWKLVDYSLPDFTQTREVPVEVPIATTGYIAYASIGFTLFDNGVYIDSTQNRTGQLVGFQQPDPNRFTGMTITDAQVVPQGLAIATYRSHTMTQYHPMLVRLPANGDITPSDSYDFNPWSQAERVATTPQGMLYHLQDGLFWVGTGQKLPGTRVATIINPSWPMITVFDSAASSILVGGNWGKLAVGGREYANKLIEFNTTSGTPVPTNFNYDPVRYTTAPVAVARNGDRIYVAEHAPTPIVRSFSANGALLGNIASFTNGEITAMTVIPGATPRLMVGGVFLTRMINNQEVPRGLYAVNLANATVNSNILPDAPIATDMELIMGANGSPTLWVAQMYFANGMFYDVIALNPSTFAVDVARSVSVEGNVEAMATDGSRLWIGGDFKVGEFGGSRLRASSIAVIDTATGRALVRPAPIPPAEPLNVQPVNPEVGVIPPVEPAPGAAMPNPIPAQDVVTTPQLPTSGVAEQGVYMVNQPGIGPMEVVIGADGSMRFDLSALETAAPGRPNVTKLTPQSRAVKVNFSRVPGALGYRVTTKVGKKTFSCRTSKTSCVIKDLEPWRAYSFTVAVNSGKPRVTGLASPKISPFVKVSKGKTVSLRSIVAPGAKGKAAYTTTGTCKVRGASLVTPKSSTRCLVTVKAGKSTRKVQVRVS